MDVTQEAEVLASSDVMRTQQTSSKSGCHAGGIRPQARLHVMQEAGNLYRYRDILATHGWQAGWSKSNWLCVLVKGKAEHGTMVEVKTQYEDYAYGRWMVAEVQFGKIRPGSKLVGDEVVEHHLDPRAATNELIDCP